MAQSSKPRRRTTVRLPRDLAERLDLLKKRDGTTIQHAVIAALGPYLDEKGLRSSKSRAA